MTIACFTSISLNYLPKARVLAQSLKRFHPDWHLTLCVTDRCPEGFSFDLAREKFDAVVWAEQLIGGNARAWLFQHEVVEACTAVKGPMLEKLLLNGASKVFYLDPDVAVFGPLDPMLEMLDRSSILLTPHQLTPETTRSAIVDNEICSLSHGTYNLGFIAVRNDSNGQSLAAWWRERLLEYCVDDRNKGIFVDQKWCDLVPAMFDGVQIVRDPGYNVASWNLSNRKMEFDQHGRCLVNGAELRFFHFTKLGPIGDAMTRIYAKDNVEVYELWSWYKRMVDRMAVSEISSGWWHYALFSNGVRIPRVARLLYRERAELREQYTDPFDASSGNSYFSWLVESNVIAA